MTFLFNFFFCVDFHRLNFLNLFKLFSKKKIKKKLMDETISFLKKRTISDIHLNGHSDKKSFKVSSTNIFNQSMEGSMMLEWTHRPSSALIIEKIRDSDARKYLLDAIHFLHMKKSFNIFVEEYVANEVSNLSFLNVFRDSDDDHVDFVLVFGGDGTLLHVSSLFPNNCPPIIPFALGSLGFLTPFKAEDYQQMVDNVIRGYFFVTSRTRIICDIIRDNQIVESKQALNDVVFTPSEPGVVCSLECFVDDEMFTVIYGDGLIVSTSTGSTAYNLSAGGAMVHPSVATIMWTPIAAHALHAHPLLFPDCVTMSFKIAENTRTEKPYLAVVDSYKMEVLKNDIAVIHQSPFPMPTVCVSEPITDWLSSISGVLRWNQPMEEC